MGQKLSSVQLSRVNELTIQTPTGKLCIYLDRTAAQCLAAGLQSNAGVPEQKTAHLARFSSYIACDEVDVSLRLSPVKEAVRQRRQETRARELRDYERELMRRTR